ncbi:MAG: ATP-binding protein [Acidobacteriota bacterium]|nr:ATP-binding protein [Acidobacteriota bacterium]
MDNTALQKVIADWLRSADFPASTPREAPVPTLDPPRPVLSVAGPRRAGKTVYLYQLAAGLLKSGRAVREDILFVDFEDYRLRDFRPEDMDRLLAAFHQLTGRSPSRLFFDEIQRLPAWSRVVRTLHNTRKYAIVVTGSNASLLGSEIATELRGRYEDVLILPFSFREFLAFRGISWSPALLSTPESGLVLRAFDEYLRYGGFPEVAAAADEPAKRKLLQTYFDTTFYRDILDRHGIRARDLLDLLMRNLLEGYASVFSISAFEKQLKAHGLPGSKRSIANYLRFLEEAFFVTVCEKFDYSPRKRTMNPKKIHLVDTGLSLLSGSFSENRGRLLENAVAVELFRRREKPMYFKGRGECDFIVRRGNRPEEAWQVCWELNAANKKRELNGFAEARRELGITKGGILTYNQEETRTLNGESVLVRPVWKWLLDANSMQA